MGDSCVVSKIRTSIHTYYCRVQFRWETLCTDMPQTTRKKKFILVHAVDFGGMKDTLFLFVDVDETTCVRIYQENLNEFVLT